ncbi:hypothetical protein B0A48_01412 [Cryoendolithus antarcticus]|uniref:Uncharacterized protein n=1 Tax=Cryoendolithus antarcticus TaxID=1507870 RepID=A0A1V8TT50_9PEZI|nr:hypothetical protein B0A48_01412 [Cryoendolithus antarcticus]
MSLVDNITRESALAANHEELDHRLSRCNSVVQQLLAEAEAALKSVTDDPEQARELAVQQLRQQRTALLPAGRMSYSHSRKAQAVAPSRLDIACYARYEDKLLTFTPPEHDASAHARKSAAPRLNIRGRCALSMHSGTQRPTHIAAKRQDPVAHGGHRLFGVEKRWMW